LETGGENGWYRKRPAGKPAGQWLNQPDLEP
jgi:hypothetical protein